MKPQHSTVGCTEEAPELRDSCLVPEPSPDGSLPEHMVSERDESGSPDAKRRKSEREAQPHEVGCAGQPCASADAHAAEGASFPDVVSVPHDAAAMVESSKPPHGGSSAGCHGVASPNGRPGTSAAFPADECKEGGGQDGFPFKTECLATGVIPSPNANELLLLGGHGGMDEYTLGLPEQLASVPSGVFDEGAHFPSDTSTEEIDSDVSLFAPLRLPSIFTCFALCSAVTSTNVNRLYKKGVLCSLVCCRTHSMRCGCCRAIRSSFLSRRVVPGNLSEVPRRIAIKLPASKPKMPSAIPMKTLSIIMSRYGRSPFTDSLRSGLPLEYLLRICLCTSSPPTRPLMAMPALTFIAAVAFAQERANTAKWTGECAREI